MKNIVFLFLSFLLGITDLIAQDLVPAQNSKGKWGYVDFDGNKVIDYDYSEVSSFKDGIAKVKKGNKWGYIDANGKQVIKIKYTEMYEWDNNVCKVAVGGKVKDGIITGQKWGFIDRTGNEILAVEYDEISTFVDGLAFVRKEDKYGYIKKDYSFLIPCEYTGIGAFNSQGFCWVNKGGKIDKKNNPKLVKGGRFGVYNRDGEVVVPIKYKAIGTFNVIPEDANPIIAKIHNNKEYIDELIKIKKDGWNVVLSSPNPKSNAFNFKFPYDLNKGIKYINEEKKKLENKFIDKLSSVDKRILKECGNVGLLSHSYINTELFTKMDMPYNNYIVVANSFKYNNQQGLLNEFYYNKSDSRMFQKIGIYDGDGNLILEEGKYPLAFCPISGIIPISREKKKKRQVNFYIVSTGQFIFDNWQNSDVVTPFENGSAIIAVDNEQYLIDKSGKRISEIYDLILPQSQGTFVVKKDDLYGLVDSCGMSIINPSYNLIMPNKQGRMLAQKEKGGKFGFLDKNGTFVIEPKYVDALSFNFGWASVKTSEGWGEIDEFGNEIVKCKWYNSYNLTEYKPKFIWVQSEKDKLWYCLYTKDNTLLLDKGFSSASNFNKYISGVAIVKGKNGKLGCLNSEGVIFLPFEFESYELAIKACKMFLDKGLKEWRSIDSYKFRIYNDPRRFEIRLNDKVENEMWDY